MADLEQNLDSRAEYQRNFYGAEEAVSLWTSVKMMVVAPFGISMVAGVVFGYLGAAFAVTYEMLVGPLPIVTVVIVTSSSGMLLAFVSYAVFWYSMIVRLSGLHQPRQMSGHVKIERKVSPSRTIFDSLPVHPDYLKEMAQLVVGHNAQMTHAWERYFAGRGGFTRFRDEMMRRRYAEWLDPLNHRGGVMWTEEGYAFWKDVYEHGSTYPTPE